MEPAAYVEHAAYERTHWWFAGRRAVVRSLLEPVARDGFARALAVGCGYGAELDFLGTFAPAVGTEIESAPLRSAHAGGSRRVAKARAEDLPFAGESFGLVAMLDVLEHVAAADRALAEARRVLRPGGYLVLLVPALEWLWSDWDVRVHHRRRYTTRSLAGALQGANLRLCRLSYFNCALLPVVAAVRRLAPVRRLARPADGDEFALGSSPIANRVLGGVLRAEAWLVRRTSLPIGVSLVALARRDP
jgi:SAM-dependent methyltransferase